MHGLSRRSESCHTAEKVVLVIVSDPIACGVLGTLLFVESSEPPFGWGTTRTIQFHRGMPLTRLRLQLLI